MARNGWGSVASSYEDRLEQLAEGAAQSATPTDCSLGADLGPAFKAALAHLGLLEERVHRLGHDIDEIDVMLPAHEETASS